MRLKSLLGRIVRPAPEPEPPPPSSNPPLIDVEGVCPVCEQQTRFQSWGPGLRDGFICITCHSLPRERALFAVLARVCPGWRGLQVHESSPSEGPGKLARECPGYTASHYDPGRPLGEISEQGWRNEDLERQTFEDGRFDLVITQDVFEHLLEPDRAIREIARTLKPRGLHVATVPLARKTKPSRRRARRLDDGSVKLLRAAEHHANPIDPQGSLVTVDWGYDIADYFDRHAGLSTTVVAIEDFSRGIAGDMIEVLVSRKAAPPRL